MATTWSRLLRALALPLVLALSTWPALAVSAADTVAFTISDARVTESSGLARDRGAGVYWTVNDSGDQGTVYGVTSRGAVRGIIGYRAKPVDVEAVAVEGRRLYVGDIGDNRARRPFVTVYYFDNAEPNNQTVPYRAYDFSYPDGPHDAETLLVDGRGRLYLVTKGLKGGIYAAPDRPSRQGVNRLRRVGDAPAYVTDGVFLPGGRQIALRTYVSVETVDAGSYAVVGRAALPLQRQGESVALSLDGRSLLVGSEGKKSSVLKVPVPATLGRAPSAGSVPPSTKKPTPAPAPSTTAGADDNPDAEPTPPAASRTGTAFALSLAGLVALIAGVVVAARRR